MTDVEPKTPKRKSLPGQDKKTPAKKAKLEKTPQKGASPKGQNIKKQNNVQNSQQKFNKKNKRNSESESDSPKKLKLFPGIKPSGNKTDNKNKDENTSGEKKKRNRSKSGFYFLTQKIQSGENEEALKTIEKRIKEIETRHEITKSAKRKLTALKRLQKLAKGEPLETPQSQKPPQNKSDLTKSGKKNNAKKQQNQVVAQGKAAVPSGNAKINGKAKNAKVQNKPVAKKTVPQLQVEEDDDDDDESDSDDDQDVQDEENDSDDEDDEEIEGESAEEGSEEDSGEESDEVEGEEDDESDDDDSEEESAPPVKVQEDATDESDSDEVDQDSHNVEIESNEEDKEQESHEEKSLPKKNKRKSDSNNDVPNKKQKLQSSDTSKSKVKAEKSPDLNQLKKGNIVTEKQKRFVLFVGNIPYDTNKQDLIEHFQKSGEIKHIRIPTEKKNSKPRGFAYVELTNEESYQKCLSLHHTFLKGRRINVLYTQGGKKKGDDKKKEIKAKNFKLHAMRKQGQLAGSVKQSQKRSFRRTKQKGNKAGNEEQ